jgi:hypothetical protein
MRIEAQDFAQDFGDDLVANVRGLLRCKRKNGVKKREPENNC